MALFQQSVVNRYLDAQAQVNKTLDQKWQMYSNYFLNETIQNNIKQASEIQYQGEFLNNLFVHILGYTRFPNSNFTLKTEYKNEINNQRVDCAIFVENNVRGVIELKDTKTADLGKVAAQAFGYKNKHSNCIYVITSNFEKLRFYIDNEVNYLEFNLFTLTKEEFYLLHLCLACENIAQDIPKKMKEGSSENSENEITQRLYKDYSVFKNELYQNIFTLNYKKQPKSLLYCMPKLSQISPKTHTITLKITHELLLIKTQKLLDRFLFLCFAEDKLLLASNSVKLILDKWKKPHLLDDDVPLYDRFKKYFSYLHTGFERNQDKVFGYNGGLFKPDAILDGLKIENELLYKHISKLAYYNFASEVDVNILGRIFENSLNPSHRRNEGIFYTPKYITKYIVENTIGKLCQEQKEKLEIRENEFTIKPPQTKNKKEKELFEKQKSRLNGQVETYREWLLQLTILDPACGSGAFLNEALQFLIEEHKFIHYLKAKISNELPLDNIENTILENNIFGVDLNEESVEIAKLSLWLRTAHPDRKLTDLSNNIKCGNSLINDAQVAGNKAFNWQENFPKVFEKGGFDVVIGNPPYVDMRGIKKNHIEYFQKRYVTASNRVNLFALFVEHSFKVMKNEGKYGMIIHRNLIRSNEYEKCRELILNNTELNEILSFRNGVFDGVVGEMTILTFSKKNLINPNNMVKVYNYENQIDTNISETIIPQNVFNNSIGKRFNLYLTAQKTVILAKISSDKIPLSQISYTLQGIIAGDEERLIASNPLNEHYKPIYRGRNIQRYVSIPPSEYIYFAEEVLTRARRRENFEHPEKILTQHVAGGIKAFLDCEQIYYMQTINGTIINNENFKAKYILAVLNSRLIDFYYNNTFNLGAEFTTAVAITNLNLLPIPDISLEAQQPFVEKAHKMLSLNKQLRELVQEFRNYIMLKFAVQSLSEKLQNWHLLNYVDFMGEVQNKKISISFSQIKGFQEEFDKASQEARSLANEIAQTDNEIDQMVYELYGLTPEEIAIVEKG